MSIRPNTKLCAALQWLEVDGVQAVDARKSFFMPPGKGDSVEAIQRHFSVKGSETNGEGQELYSEIALSSLTLDQLRSICPVFGMKKSKSTKAEIIGNIHRLCTSSDAFEDMLAKRETMVKTTIEQRQVMAMRLVTVVFCAELVMRTATLYDKKDRLEYEIGNGSNDCRFWITVSDLINDNLSHYHCAYLCCGVANQFTAYEGYLDTVITKLEMHAIASGPMCKGIWNDLVRVFRKMKAFMSTSGNHDSDPMLFCDMALKACKLSKTYSALTAYYFYIQCESNPNVSLSLATSLDAKLKGSWKESSRPAKVSKADPMDEVMKELVQVIKASVQQAPATLKPAPVSVNHTPITVTVLGNGAVSTPPPTPNVYELNDTPAGTGAGADGTAWLQEETKVMAEKQLEEKKAARKAKQIERQHEKQLEEKKAARKAKQIERQHQALWKEKDILHRRLRSKEDAKVRYELAMLQARIANCGQKVLDKYEALATKAAVEIENINQYIAVIKLQLDEFIFGEDSYVTPRGNLCRRINGTPYLVGKPGKPDDDSGDKSDNDSGDEKGDEFDKDSFHEDGALKLHHYQKTPEDLDGF